MVGFLHGLQVHNAAVADDATNARDRCNFAGNRTLPYIRKLPLRRCDCLRADIARRQSKSAVLVDCDRAQAIARLADRLLIVGGHAGLLSGRLCEALIRLE